MQLRLFWPKNILFKRRVIDGKNRTQAPEFNSIGKYSRFFHTFDILFHYLKALTILKWKPGLIHTKIIQRVQYHSHLKYFSKEQLFVSETKPRLLCLNFYRCSFALKLWVIILHSLEALATSKWKPGLIVNRNCQ